MRYFKLLLCAIFCFSFVVLMEGKEVKGNRLKTKSFNDQRAKKNVTVIDDEVIIKFKTGVAESKIDKMHKRLKVRTVKKFAIRKIYKVKISTTATVEDIIESYKNDPDVQFAEPNFTCKTFNVTPNDNLSGEQWPIYKIELNRAWDIEKGQTNPVTVAVIDTGIDKNHEDLKDNVISGYDFVNEDNDAMDDNGHGTEVAGIIGASGNNGKGIAGINWYCKLMPVKVMDSAGVGTYYDLYQGIMYAADNNAKVINLSVGGYGYSELLQEAINYAVNRGCIIVSAVGDDNTDSLTYPAGLTNVIGVASLTKGNEMAYESNYNNSILLFAPGVSVYSTSLNNNYRYCTGSSFATAHVSGVISLLLSASQQTSSFSEIKQILINNADYIKPDKRKGSFGYGCINPYRILTSVKGIVNIDIAVVNVEIIPERPVIGQTTKVRAAIQNQSNISSEPTSVKLTIEGKVINNISIPALAPNQIIVKEFNWKP